MTEANKFRLLINYCEATLLLHFANYGDIPYVIAHSSNAYAPCFRLVYEAKIVRVSIEPLNPEKPNEYFGLRIGRGDDPVETNYSWSNANQLWPGFKRDLDCHIQEIVRYLKS